MHFPLLRFWVRPLFLSPSNLGEEEAKTPFFTLAGLNCSNEHDQTIIIAGHDISSRSEQCSDSRVPELGSDLCMEGREQKIV